MRQKSLTCRCGGRLLSTALAEGLPARVCAACGGTLLALDKYRSWRRPVAPQYLATAKPSEDMPPVADDDGKARPCPACAGLMTRYRVSAGHALRLDRCSRCQLVWFDDGEWAVLVAAGLENHLDSILTDGWQRRIQLDEAQQRREANLRQRLGNEVVDELRRIQSWLRQQPNSQELLALLGSESL